MTACEEDIQLSNRHVMCSSRPSTVRQIVDEVMAQTVCTPAARGLRQMVVDQSLKAGIDGDDYIINEA